MPPRSLFERNTNTTYVFDWDQELPEIEGITGGQTNAVVDCMLVDRNTFEIYPLRELAADLKSFINKDTIVDFKVMSVENPKRRSKSQRIVTPEGTLSKVIVLLTGMMVSIGSPDILRAIESLMTTAGLLDNYRFDERWNEFIICNFDPINEPSFKECVVGCNQKALLAKKCKFIFSYDHGRFPGLVTRHPEHGGCILIFQTGRIIATGRTRATMYPFLREFIEFFMAQKDVHVPLDTEDMQKKLLADQKKKMRKKPKRRPLARRQVYIPGTDIPPAPGSWAQMDSYPGTTAASSQQEDYLKKQVLKHSAVLHTALRCRALLGRVPAGGVMKQKSCLESQKVRKMLQSFGSFVPLLQRSLQQRAILAGRRT